MSRLGRAAVVLALGAVSLRLVVTGGFGYFLQQSMRTPLLLAGLVMVALGGYELVAATVAHRRDPAADRVSVAPAVGWLLLLPLCVLVAVAPTGLGAAAADRVEPYVPAQRTDVFDTLEPSLGPVEMRVVDFLERARWDPKRTLEGVPVRLEGLVVNDDGLDDGFRLTRFLVGCCAADGVPMQVVVHGVGSPLPDDTWVTVDLSWRPPASPYGSDGDDVVIEADAIDVVPLPDAPDAPYETPY